MFIDAKWHYGVSNVKDGLRLSLAADRLVQSSDRQQNTIFTFGELILTSFH